MAAEAAPVVPAGVESGGGAAPADSGRSDDVGSPVLSPLGSIGSPTEQELRDLIRRELDDDDDDDFDDDDEEDDDEDEDDEDED